MFLTAPAVRSPNTSKADRTLKELAADYGLSDMSNRDGAAVKRAPAVKPAPAKTSSPVRAQSNGGQSGSFFKSKPGILALAVMAAGAGYAVYSTQHDRIKSAGK